MYWCRVPIVHCALTLVCCVAYDTSLSRSSFIHYFAVFFSFFLLKKFYFSMLHYIPNYQKFLFYFCCFLLLFSIFTENVLLFHATIFQTINKLWACLVGYHSLPHNATLPTPDLSWQFGSLPRLWHAAAKA